MSREWILASGSPRRRELLARFGRPFRVEVPVVEEWEPAEADPVEQVEWNAVLKMRALAGHYPSSLVVAADTTVALGRCLFAKPADHGEARRMLASLSGRTHRVVTGVAFAVDGRERVFHEDAQVDFHELTATDIEEYLGCVEVLDKAGAYGIQQSGQRVISAWRGDFETIMGLPIQRLWRELVLHGVECEKPKAHRLDSGKE